MLSSKSKYSLVLAALSAVALGLLWLVQVVTPVFAQTPFPTATPPPPSASTASETVTIEYGQVVEGRLNNTGDFSTYFRFSGQAGDVVSVGVKSAQFNPYVTLIDPFGGEIGWDDDSGGYPNALLGPVILPQTGDYALRVTSYDYNASGVFTLDLEKLKLQPIRYGETVEVEFSGKERGQYFVFEAQSGDLVNIVALSDGTLDTRLRVRSTDLYNSGYDLAYDDDSGPGFDPEITRLLLPYATRYVIILEPYTVREMPGKVTLRIDTTPLPSLDEGPQTLVLGEKRTQDVVGFTGKAGEKVRIAVRVVSGRVDYMSVVVSQNALDMAVINGNNIHDVSFSVTVPQDGRVTVRIDNYTTAVLEVLLER